MFALGIGLLSAWSADFHRKPEDGETQTRTGDTTIFSRVLYQLSYLAGSGSALYLTRP